MYLIKGVVLYPTDPGPEWMQRHGELQAAVIRLFQAAYPEVPAAAAAGPSTRSRTQMSSLQEGVADDSQVYNTPFLVSDDVTVH